MNALGEMEGTIYITKVTPLRWKYHIIQAVPNHHIL